MSNDLSTTPWEELTDAQRNLFLEFGSQIGEDIDQLVEQLNGDVKAAKKSIIKERKSLSRSKSIYVTVSAIIGLFLPPIGLILLLFYVFRLKKYYEYQRLLHYAREEYLEYVWNNTAPDRNWGNKIRWGEDTFGDVVEKTLGLRGGSAFLRLIQFLWDNPTLAQELRKGPEEVDPEFEAEVERKTAKVRRIANRILWFAAFIPVSLYVVVGFVTEDSTVIVMGTSILMYVLYKGWKVFRE